MRIFKQTRHCLTSEKIERKSVFQLTSSSKSWGKLKHFAGQNKTLTEKDLDRSAKFY